MDFFVIAGGATPQVLRLLIEQHCQADLERRFIEQAESISHGELEVIPFEGGNFNPDESEVLEIAAFDLPAEVYDPLQNVAGCPVLTDDDATVESVKCVFGYDATSERSIFQVIPRRQRISTNSGWAGFLSKSTFKKLEHPGLILGDACHAVHENGALKFKSMWQVKQIFDISDFYRSATEADVERFASHPSLAVEDAAHLKRKSGPWVRTRIAFILDSGILDDYTPDELATKAAEFGVPLHVEEIEGQKKLSIPSAAKPKRAILKFLEEELYKGAITGAEYEANSKRRREA